MYPLHRPRKELQEQAQQPPVGGWDIFLSHSGAQQGFAKDLFTILSPSYNVFFDITRPSLPVSEPFSLHILHAAKTCRLAVVILSNEFFSSSKWPMLELCAFFAAKVRVLPLFYEISPRVLSDNEKIREWDEKWEEFASEDSCINVSSWKDARQKLRTLNGIVFQKLGGGLHFLDEIRSIIYQMTPPLYRSSHAGVRGKDRLCKLLFDKFEELERRLQNPRGNPFGVCLLGVYGFPGSGKSTLCACLRDACLPSFAGKALHLKLPTDPSPIELLGIGKELLKLTNIGHDREKMMSEVEDLSQMFGFLEGCNLRNARGFLVFDNILSQESIDFVKAILSLGVGVGSRVMLVARTKEILSPLLKFAGEQRSHVHYVCGEMRVPSVNEEEAISVLLQPVGGLSVASDFGQKTLEKYSSSHREIIAKVAQMCAFPGESSPVGHQDPLFLPLALKIVGSELRSNRMYLETWSRELLRRNTGMVQKFREDAVKKIVEESYQKLSENVRLLFCDVALFLVPYCRFYAKDRAAFELLGFMHECSPDVIKIELNELMKHCFLENRSSVFIVHDLLLEFAKSIPDACCMYYCRGRKMAGEEVRSDLSMRAHSPRVGLRALILEVDDVCKRFDFPPGLSSVKVVVVRNCKSLAVLGLAGLTELVSLIVEGCPRLRYVELDPNHANTLKSVRWAKWGDCNDISDQPEQGGFQKSLLQMLQAEWLMNRVWCSMSALAGWCHKPPLSGYMSLASQSKALQVLRLEKTGISSLGDLSGCWPQLQVLEVLEANLEILELGNLPNLKRFVYEGLHSNKPVHYCYSPRGIHDPRMPRNPNLLAGCPELEEVLICDPSHEDGMGTLILPPNLRSLSVRSIFHGEPVLPDFTSLAHSLEDVTVCGHWVLHSVGFTRWFFSLARINMELCPNLVRISGLEWLPNLQALVVNDCAKLQSLGNLEALEVLERLELEDCPVLEITSQAPRSQHLATVDVRGCPNVQFFLSDLENLSALSYLRCNAFGSMFKLRNLLKLEEVWLDGKCDGQASNPLSLCNYDDEASCEQGDRNIAQVPGVKYLSLFVVGESAVPHLSELALCGVQYLVSLDGIQCLYTLKGLLLEDLPQLACLQGLASLIDLEELCITRCMAIKELSSLCSLVKLVCLSVTYCVNLILLKGLHNMRSLRVAILNGCKNLECLELGPLIRRVEFKGCKCASIQALVGWVLDEQVSEALLGASLDALTWELTIHLLEKPKERMELAEQLVETLGVYLTKRCMAFTHLDDHFDFKPWIDELKAAVTRFEYRLDRVREDGCKEEVDYPKGLEELMEEQSRVPLKEVLQRCQSDAHFRASTANCIMEAHPEVLGDWITRLVTIHFPAPDATIMPPRRFLKKGSFSARCCQSRISYGGL